MSDRDSYQSKRVETCGTLIGNLLSQSLLRLSREIKTNLQKKYLPVYGTSMGIIRILLMISISQKLSNLISLKLY